MFRHLLPPGFTYSHTQARRLRSLVSFIPPGRAVLIDVRGQHSRADHEEDGPGRSVSDIGGKDEQHRVRDVSPNVGVCGFSTGTRENSAKG